MGVGEVSGTGPPLETVVPTPSPRTFYKQLTCLELTHLRFGLPESFTTVVRRTTCVGPRSTSLSVPSVGPPHVLRSPEPLTDPGVNPWTYDWCDGAADDETESLWPTNDIVSRSLRSYGGCVRG